MSQSFPFPLRPTRPARGVQTTLFLPSLVGGRPLSAIGSNAAANVDAGVRLQVPALSALGRVPRVQLLERVTIVFLGFERAHSLLHSLMFSCPQISPPPSSPSLIATETQMQ